MANKTHTFTITNASDQELKSYLYGYFKLDHEDTENDYTNDKKITIGYANPPEFNTEKDFYKYEIVRAANSPYQIKSVKITGTTNIIHVERLKYGVVRKEPYINWCKRKYINNGKASFYPKNWWMDGMTFLVVAVPANTTIEVTINSK